MTQREIIEAEIEKFTQRLAEMGCDVQVLATWIDQGCTDHAFSGRGNWYSRKGMAQGWLEQACEPRINPETVRIEDEE